MVLGWDLENQSGEIMFRLMTFDPHGLHGSMRKIMKGPQILKIKTRKSRNFGEKIGGL